LKLVRVAFASLPPPLVPIALATCRFAGAVRAELDRAEPIRLVVAIERATCRHRDHRDHPQQNECDV
jgi:hypothetical protein